MRILVITRNNWNVANNVGNSLSNIFSWVDKNIEVVNLACSAELPRNNICINHFVTSEKKLLKSIITGKDPWINLQDAAYAPDVKYIESKIKRFFRAHDLTLARFVRELIWVTGVWKSHGLKQFLTSFNPDIVIMPVYGCWFMHKIFHYTCTVIKSKNVLLFWDDYSTLKQKSFSPLFWLNRLILRSEVKKSLYLTDKSYSISPKMQQEYLAMYGIYMDILTKSYDFEEILPKQYKLNNSTLKMIYLGNIGNGRWKTLNKLAKTIQAINQEAGKKVFELNVYTLSTRTHRIEQALNIENSSNIEEYLPSAKVAETLESVDILVHVEPVDTKERLKYRLSFSTKVVDYFKAQRCILAFGDETGTIEYLQDTDASIVITQKDNIKQKLLSIASDRSILEKYAKRAWECGKKNHNKKIMNEKIRSDLEMLIEKRNT